MNKFVFCIFQYLLLLSLVLSCFWTHALQYLSFPRRLVEDNLLALNFEHRTYYSHINFNQQGSLRNISDEGYILLMDYHLSFFYSPNQWFQISPYIEAQTHMVNHPSKEIQVLPFFPTLSGIKVFSSIHVPYLSILPEIDFTFPLDVQNPINRIITNDGVFSTTPSLALFLNLSRLHPFARIGYHWRYFISDLLFAQLGLLYRDNILEIGGLIGGFTSVTSGRDSNSLNRHKDLERYNLGSLKFYSVLPTSLGTSVWLDINLNRKFHFLTQFNFNWMGLNYAQGYTLHLGIRYSFIKRANLREQYKKSIRRFKQNSYDMNSLYQENSKKETFY